MRKLRLTEKRKEEVSNLVALRRYPLPQVVICVELLFSTRGGGKRLQNFFLPASPGTRSPLLSPRVAARSFIGP